jgi:hypothetical protein
MHRTYHVSRMPTWNRRIRILVDWTGALFFGREVVALGQIHEPRAEFSRVAGILPSRQTDAPLPEWGTEGEHPSPTGIPLRSPT